MKTRRKLRGFTLIEMVISTLILSVAVVAISALMAHCLRGWSAGTSQDSATSNATIALQKLCMDVRDGQSASISAGGLAVKFPNKLTDGSTCEVIYDSSSIGSTTRYYYLQDGDLIRSDGSTTSTIARGITSVTFGASGGTVSVTLESEEQVGTATRNQRVTGRISLRNFRI